MKVASWHRGAASVTVLAVTATLAITTQASAAERDRDGAPWPPPLPPGHPVEVSPIPADPPRRSTTDERELRESPATSWPQPGSAVVDLAATGDAGAAGLVSVEGTPVSLAAAEGAAAVPGRVRVEVLDRVAADRAGVTGLLLRLARADGESAPTRLWLDVDYSSFRSAFGGDWAARLRLARVDGERLVPVESRNDVAEGRLSAKVTLDGTGTFAVTAGASGPVGDYTATSLSPTGSWQVAANSGTFTWSNPLQPPATPGGLAPDLGLVYSSGSVDGKTVAANGQPSWVGEGWELWPGFVERGYRGCSVDGGPRTGDQCWAGENATLSLGGRSTSIIRDTDDADGDGNRTEHRLRDDDGTRVEQLFESGNGDDNGEYWKLTTPDGVQYIFGRTPDSAWTLPVFGNQADEPCHGGSFAESKCDQAWRWNLNQVIDPHQNTITYTYAEETNFYAMNMGALTASYTRGGWLAQAEYGTRVGGSGSAPARVRFDVAERCIPGSPCAQTGGSRDYPDVPLDQKCDGGSCAGKYSPTFWSTKRLSTITTEVLKDGAYQDVSRWSLRQTFPAPGDGTSASLWLAGVTQTGLANGEQSLPEVTFGGEPYHNRVSPDASGRAPMTKFRLARIGNESGGDINIRYEYQPGTCQPDALPEAGNNPLRCFPVYWQPEVGEAVTEFFHKYVVSEVNEDDRVGGTGNFGRYTSYEYVGDAAWRFDDNPITPPERRTWSQWRGYQKVIVHTGAPWDSDVTRSAVQYLYFRGMNGDPLPGSGTRSVEVTDSRNTSVPDDNEYAGFLREQITYNGDTSDPVVSKLIRDPWRRGPTATQGDRKAFMVLPGAEEVHTALDGGQERWRTTRVDTTHDGYGMVTEVDDRGDIADPDDDRCTTTTYARDVDRWLLNLPAQVETVAVGCDQTPVYPRDAITDVRSFYDGSNTLGAAPSAGDVTRVEQVKGYSGGSAQVVAVSRNRNDSYGRVTETMDALGRATTTVYTDTYGLTTASVMTSPDPDGAGPLTSHVTTTTLDPELGQPVRISDPNGRLTTLSYDPLGRLSSAWLPGSLQQYPNLRFAYEVRNDAASWVRTERLNANWGYTSSYTLFDGFLRERQTQAPSPQGGRVLTDTLHNSLGLVAKTNAGYWDPDRAPDGTLHGDQDGNPISDEDVHAQTRIRYDGAGRQVESAFYKLGTFQWQTTTSHTGDSVSVDPPAGGTPTTTIVDARGQTTALLQYHGGGPSGEADRTEYTYTDAGQLATVTDPAGNQWRYEYDLLGRRFRDTDPDRGVSTSTFDDAGQLRSTTDARGHELTYTYDNLGRKTELRDGAGNLRAQWTYDTILKGMPTGSTRHHGGAAYSSQVTGYDAAYRPTGRSITIPAAEPGLGNTYTTTMTYKPDNSLYQLRVPAVAGHLPLETITYGYTSTGGLTLPRTMRGGLSASTYVSETSYSELAEPQQLLLNNSQLAQTRTYEDGTRRLARVLVSRQHISDTQLADVSYSYDQAGNVSRIADQAAGRPADRQCFRYDYLRRLAEAWTPNTNDCQTDPTTATLGGPAPYWTEYDYDLTGNRLRETQHTTVGFSADTVRTYTYPDPGQFQPHTLTAVTTTGPNGTRTDAYDYDQTGNTIARPGQQLDWDIEGRLASVTTDAGTTSFVYDADGNRLVRRDPQRTTIYLDGQEIHRNTTTGEMTGTRYYSQAGQVVAVRTQTGLQYLFADHHGTAEIAVHQTTGVVTPRRHDPFGNLRGTQPIWPGQRGFVGGTIDPGTGLTHLGAREYDPTTGRFVSVDPILDPNDPQQINGYTYANNNPTTISDPAGLAPQTSCPDGECPFGGPGGGWKPGESPAATFNSPPPNNNNGSPQGTRCPDGAKTCGRALWPSGPPPRPTPKPFDFEYLKQHGKPAPYDQILDEETVAEILNMCALLNGSVDCDREFHFSMLDQLFKLNGFNGGVLEYMTSSNTERWLVMTGLACSFSGDTPVLMADGTTKPIAEIKPGDKVLALDPRTGQRGAKTVTRVLVHDDTVIDLEIEGEVVTTTEDHPFWNETDQQWQRADTLDPGDHLLTAHGDTVTVEGIIPDTELLTSAYNLTVTDIHTYYVAAGPTPVLVHNCPSGSPARVSPAYQDWGTKGAHVHIGNHEVRIFPDGNGGIGAAPITTRAGTATADDVASALAQLRTNPELRADLIRQAESSMDSMNAGEWGMATNRAAEMHFLIQALKGMG